MQLPAAQRVGITAAGVDVALLPALSAYHTTPALSSHGHSGCTLLPLLNSPTAVGDSRRGWGVAWACGASCFYVYTYLECDVEHSAPKHHTLG